MDSALDRLELLETLSEEWPQGYPTKGGWFPRVRIVKTSFKSGLLRIEENVEAKAEGGSIAIARSRIEAAVDARHVLVSSIHAAQLAANGIGSEIARNPNYVKVPTELPLLASSIPALTEKLNRLGMREIEADSVIGACAQANDPVIGNGIAWHLENLGLLPGHRVKSDIGAPSAWDTQTDASSVLIAVIDSGIASSDPELAPSIYAFPRETLGDGIDNDRNGYVDDALGYDFYQDDSNPEDEAGHGSLCTALIGATGNNGYGSSGVAWNASILNCKFLNRDGLGTLSDAIDAVDYARTAGARILNLSWSYSGDATLLEAALGRCDSAGILMVCASGNSGSFAPVPAPASIDLPHLVAVAASTPSDSLASFSSVDPLLVDLAAPGVDLPVAIYNNPWDPGAAVAYPSGTSFSAALVSGSLALGLAEFPSETPKRMLRRMLESVDPIPGGASALSSGGRLNLAKMLGTPPTSIPHDLFDQRMVLADPSGRWSGRNDGATAESMDFNLGLSPLPQRTTWFEWTAASSGLLRLSANASNGTAVRLSAFATSGGLPAGLLAQSTMGQVIEIPVVTGQKMLWMLDTSIPISEGLTLTWQLPPSNDNWHSALEVNGLPLTLSGNSLGATVESYELTEYFYPWLPNGSVWWKWTPGVSGDILISPTPGHLAFLRPLSGGKPSFLPSFGFSNWYNVELGQSYAILVIPVSTASAGGFSVSIAAVGDIAIMQQPASFSALAGETVELEVQVSASTDTSYQWFKNGEAIPFANDSRLRLAPVLPQSFGSYHVVVTSTNSTLQSQPAVVSPRYEKPRLLTKTLTRSAVTGQLIDLNATFRSSSEMTYQWRKNGVLIAGVNSTTLIINNATASDAGTYSLTATNPAGASLTTFQVNIVDTPWKGWVNRTPGTTGRGAIINVVMNGLVADAFTASEWLRSSDGGQSWNTNRLPANLVAKSCATDSNGTAIISGGLFRDFGYLSGEVWKCTPTGGWQKIQPVVDQPVGTTISELEKLTFFDGKWWAFIYSNYSYIAAYSTNGINWTALADPANSGQPMRATELFKFEDRLAIAYWNPSSAQSIQLRLPGGGTKVLNFLNRDVRALSRIGGSCYYPSFDKVLKNQDGQTIPTEISMDGAFSSSMFFEGIQKGELYSGLEVTLSTTGVGTGALRQGFHEKTSTSRNIGFSCFTKSNNRWLVGYPDGRIWSGSDLNEIPSWSQDFDATFRNNKLKAYENEFLFQRFHSSDGSNWQDLGAANQNSSSVRPLGSAGATFLHSIRENGYNQPNRSFISASMFPSALGPSDSTDFQSYVWSGEDTLLNFQNSTAAKFVKIIRNQPPGLLINEVNLGVDWSEIKSAKQINGRWFVSGYDSRWFVPFIKTSGDGVNWTNIPLSGQSVIGRKGANIIAIESPSRGYFSTNGTGWTPFTPQGLPSVANVPTAIVAYRGYYVAQYGQGLYSSQDGIAWASSPAPLPISYIQENRHTMLVVTEDRTILQPSGETDSGPTVVLPQNLYSVTVSRNQVFNYEVTAEDADGDLAKVECLQNGSLIASITSPPFFFPVNPSIPGVYAIEFVAKDLAGRTSRVTSRLKVLNGGVPLANLVTIDFDLSKAVFFKGDYYRIYKDPMNTRATVCVWDSGNQWRPVSPADYKPVAIIANEQALVASTLEGILATADGLNWTHLGGFEIGYNSAPTMKVKDGMFYLNDGRNNWVSANGFSWSKTDVSLFTHSGNLAWADSDYGLNNSGASGNSITTDGGRNWMTVDKTVDSGKVLPVSNGFIVSNSVGIFRIFRGETLFTQIDQETEWPAKLYAQKVDSLVFIGKLGGYLKSTTDGVSFINHTRPPNQNRLTIRRFSGEWLSISSDMICASKDLRTWRTVIDFRSSSNDLWYLNSFNNLTVSQYGIDGDLLIENDYSLPDFILHPDFSMTESPAITLQDTIPDGKKGGLVFKSRTIAMSHSWYYTRSAENSKWERASLYPSEGFVPSYPHDWPTTNSDRYYPTQIFAATDQRFVLLRPDTFNAPLNYVITSDDGRSFMVHSWTGPIPLPEVTRLASTPTMFLASATNGRVLRSTNGLQWNVYQVSPNLEITSILFYAGKWHVGGKQGADDEIWSSVDGISWARALKVTGTASSVNPITRSAFIVDGVARMYVGTSGWFRSSGGTSWLADTVLRQSITANSFTPQGEHPLGIIGSPYSYYGSLNEIVIVDRVTGSLIRRINTGAADLAWLSGVPFLHSPGRFEEWTESDPRLTSISTNPGVYGVGDNLEIRLAASELPTPSTRLQLLLSIDQKLGNDDDITLAGPAWNDGFALAGGLRRFTVPLPQSVTPGQFKVAAKFDLPIQSKDLAIENNQILSSLNSIEVPGYQLRLTTSGQGGVNTSDPRLLYPQGARLQLEAVPQKGYTFRNWSGSLVSNQSAISIVMDANKQLSLTFTQGNRTVVKTIGNGTISGAPAVSVLLQGESIRLYQKANQGWKFSGWKVNGLSQSGAALSWQPTADSTIEGIFIPDFEAWRLKAFLNAPAGNNQSWDADPDGDGLTNWQEILLSSSPSFRQSIGQLVEYRKDQLRLVFKRPQGQANSPWIKPEFTENLLVWKPVDSGAMAERILSTENGIETVEVTLPVRSGASTFFRLRMANRPPTP